MPRTRRKPTARKTYKEDSDSSDDGHDPGLLTNILGMLMNMQRRSAQKVNKRKTSKRRQSTGSCNCPHCSTPKRRCCRPKGRPKKEAKTQTTTTTVGNASINCDSDDEIVGANITDTHVDTIRNKVDNFFKALDSEEEEPKSVLNTSSTCASSKPAEEKNKDFYTIWTDSEEEIEKSNHSDIKMPKQLNSRCKEFVASLIHYFELECENNGPLVPVTVIREPSTSANTNSFSKPSTSSFSNAFSNGSELFSQAVNKSERNPEDLFAYVDDILNDCNVVDITEDKSKENIPVESLEDLKKKTDEILGSVTSLLDDLKPKPTEPEKKPADAEMEKPSCPICLETLGGPIQTMATLCGHMFCQPCITEVSKTSKKCPTCRKGVTKNKFHPVYI